MKILFRRDYYVDFIYYEVGIENNVDNLITTNNFVLETSNVVAENYFDYMDQMIE
jgi:hypothetical protein